MIRTINELAFQANIILPGIGEAEKLTGIRGLNDISDFYFEQSDRAPTCYCETRRGRCVC